MRPEPVPMIGDLGIAAQWPRRLTGSGWKPLQLDYPARQPRQIAEGPSWVSKLQSARRPGIDRVANRESDLPAGLPRVLPGHPERRSFASRYAQSIARLKHSHRVVFRT